MRRTGRTPIDVNAASRQKRHLGRVSFCPLRVRKDEIYRKLYDSLIILIEWGIIPSFDFIRKNINYILVYNELKYGKTQPSSARDRTYEYIFKLAKQEERLFEIEKFEGYLFHKTYTYTENSFNNKFIQPKELEEAANP